MKKTSVSENLFYNILYQVVITVLPILTTPYVARVLGLEASGIHSFTESIVTYFILFGSLGTSLYGIRAVARVRDNPEQLSQTTLEIIALKLVLLIATLAVYAPALCVRSEYAVIYRIHLINVVASGLDVSWFYQGIEDFKKVTIRNFIVKLLFVVSLFVFVKAPSDLPIYVFSIVASTLFGNLLMLYYLPKYTKIKPSKKLSILPHLKGCLILFVPQIMNYIYALLDRSLLGWITNTDNVGIYDQAQRLIRMVTGILMSLGYVMMARIANLSLNDDVEGIKNYIRKSINFTLFLALPAMIGMIAVAGDFIPFFLGEEFLEVIPTLKYLSPLILTLSINSILGVQLLIPIGKEKRYTLATIMGALTNVVLNILLMPRLGIVSACIASLSAELVVFTICFIAAKDMLSVRTIFKDNAFVLLACIVMYVAVVLVSKLELGLVVKLILEVAVGGLVYFTVTLITKNEILFSIFGKVKNLLKRGV